MKVEVDVLGSPSLIVLCGRKATCEEEEATVTHSESHRLRCEHNSFKLTLWWQ